MAPIEIGSGRTAEILQMQVVHCLFKVHLKITIHYMIITYYYYSFLSDYL